MYLTIFFTFNALLRFFVTLFLIYRLKGDMFFKNPLHAYIIGSFYFQKKRSWVQSCVRTYVCFFTYCVDVYINEEISVKSEKIGF